MLFMVIEQFRNGAGPVAARFHAMGRLLPAGLDYVDSWMDPERGRCFQIMDTADPTLLDEWIAHWSDLVDFEVIPVLRSPEYWSSFDSV